MSAEIKSDSRYMNEILGAIPGQPIAPTFYAAFTAVIDRIEAIEETLALPQTGRDERS